MDNEIENEVVENDNEELELVDNEDETVETEEGAQPEVETEMSDIEDEVQEEKKFTQKEMDEIIATRVNRVEREYQKKSKEQEGIINTLKVGLGKDNIQDIEEELRKFYSDQGINVPEKPKYDEYEEKILARAYANEVIEAGEDEMKKIANEIASKPYEKRTVREIETLNILGKELIEREEISELKSKGQDVSILNNSNFTEFRNKLNPNIKISEAIELYNKINSKEVKRPPNPGSANSSHTESKYKDFYTSEEVDNLTSKDLDNPKIFKAVMDSMSKWK